MCGTPHLSTRISTGRANPGTAKCCVGGAAPRVGAASSETTRSNTSGDACIFCPLCNCSEDVIAAANSAPTNPDAPVPSLPPHHRQHVGLQKPLDDEHETDRRYQEQQRGDRRDLVVAAHGGVEH